MNYARLKKEQEALLKQIKANLDIQIPNDDKNEFTKSSCKTKQTKRILRLIFCVFRIVLKLQIIV